MSAVRAEAVARRHADLDALVSEEQGRPAPDSLRLAALKRQRLMLKDLLAALRRPQRQH